jgi:hypothetical protein
LCLWSGAFASGCFSLLLVFISLLAHMPWRRLRWAMARFYQECLWADGCGECDAVFPLFYPIQSS